MKFDGLWLSCSIFDVVWQRILFFLGKFMKFNTIAASAVAVLALASQPLMAQTVAPEASGAAATTTGAGAGAATGAAVGAGIGTGAIVAGVVVAAAVVAAATDSGGSSGTTGTR